MAASVVRCLLSEVLSDGGGGLHRVFLVLLLVESFSAGMPVGAVP